jgi:hypothetical protein
MLALLLLGSSVLPARFDVCEACTSEAPCAPHAVAERDALTELRSRRKTAEPPARIALLDEAVALTRSHENAPSAAVAKFLGEALDDDDPGVRASALQRFDASQHLETSLPVLARFLDRRVTALERFKVPKFPRIAPLAGKPLGEKQREQFEEVIKAADEVDAAFGDYAGDGIPRAEVAAGAADLQAEWGAAIHRALLAAVAERGLRGPEFPPGAAVAPIWKDWLRSEAAALRP